MNGIEKLNSVGCLLETNKGLIYPMNKNGTPDLSCPISLKEDEVSHEWLSELSSVDYKKVMPFINAKNDFDEWIEWLSYNGSIITDDHYDFKEHYNNLDTFQKNLETYKTYKLN